MQLKTLIEKVKAYNPSADTELISSAWNFAEISHGTQKRASGEAFFNHPVTVSLLLADLHMDEICIAAALLHDVVEDTPVTLEQIEEKFGAKVAGIVNGVTKLGKLLFRSKEEQQAENIRKMLLAMMDDIRVILIKLADRLHNIRTLHHLPEHKRKNIARETLEIYAPLANRLGIYRFKWEMEDQAFKHLEPQIYDEIKENVSANRITRETFLKELYTVIGDKLEDSGIEGEITGRPKHFYSIYLKMSSRERDISEIYDLIAIRILVDSVRDCYAALGAVHELWPPIPGRFKDYIAVPKQNMYQSLHTTVIHPRGTPLEIQIRTHKMHQVAEMGIASHWGYKEGHHSIDPAIQSSVAWLRQMVDMQRDITDPMEWMKQIKTDLFSDEVFVFTPKGNVKVLQTNSTPVDFAYSVHTEIGHRCIGAKVNGKIVTLDYVLKNGDVIEILTSKTGTPNPDWLNFVHTSKARNKIRAWIRRQQRDEMIEKGMNILVEFWNSAIRNLSAEDNEAMAPARALKYKELDAVAKGLELTDHESILLAISQGALSPRVIMAKMFPEQAKQLARRPLPQIEERPPLEPPKTSEGLDVSGLDAAMVRFARCCTPVPGDEVTGFITRGRGVSIHRSDCPNLAPLMNEKERILEVTWDKTKLREPDFHVKIRIEAVERPGLLSDITSVISLMKLNIHSLNAIANNAGGPGIVEVVVKVRGAYQVDELLTNLNKIGGVLKIIRLMNPSARKNNTDKNKKKNSKGKTRKNSNRSHGSNRGKKRNSKK